MDLETVMMMVNVTWHPTIHQGGKLKNSILLTDKPCLFPLFILYLPTMKNRRNRWTDLKRAARRQWQAVAGMELHETMAGNPGKRLKQAGRQLLKAGRREPPQACFNNQKKPTT